MRGSPTRSQRESPDSFVDLPAQPAAAAVVVPLIVAETAGGLPGRVFGGPTAARRTAARLPGPMRATIALERSVSANQMSGNSDRRRPGVPVGEGAPGC